MAEEEAGQDLLLPIETFLDSAFETDFFRNPWPSGHSRITLYPHMDRWRPQCDVVETDKEYLVHADIPGMKREDIHIRLKDDLLMISGEKKIERESSQGDTEKGHMKYHKVERIYGKFERSIQLPKKVDQAKVKAKYENGTLQIIIPKAEVEKDAGKLISIEGA